MSQSSNLTRRTVLTAAAAAMAVAPGAVIADKGPDHPADDAELVRLVEEIGITRAALEEAQKRETNEMWKRGLTRWRIGPEVKRLWNRLNELRELVRTTPARGPAGIAAKLSLCPDNLEWDWAEPFRPLQWALADARRLAGVAG